MIRPVYANYLVLLLTKAQPGIHPDRGTKCLLALAAGELELAQEWSGWTLDLTVLFFC